MKKLNLEKLRNKLLELNNNKFSIRIAVYDNIKKCYLIIFANLYQLLILSSEIENENINIIKYIYEADVLPFNQIDAAKEVLDFIKNNEKEIIKAINESIEEVEEWK